MCKPWRVSSPDNVETVRRFYAELMGPGRMEDAATAQALPRFFGPDVEVIQTRSMVGTAGTFRGHAGVVAVTVEIVREIDDPVFVPEEIRVLDDRVAVAMRFSGNGRRSGAPLEMRGSHLFTLRDGLITRFEVFVDPAEAFTAAGIARDGEAAGGQAA